MQRINIIENCFRIWFYMAIRHIELINGTGSTKMMPYKCRIDGPTCLQAASQFPSCSHPAIAVWRFRSIAAPPPGPSQPVPSSIDFLKKMDMKMIEQPMLNIIRHQHELVSKFDFKFESKNLRENGVLTYRWHLSCSVAPPRKWQTFAYDELD